MTTLIIPIILPLPKSIDHNNNNNHTSCDLRVSPDDGDDLRVCKKSCDLRVSPNDGEAVQVSMRSPVT